MKMFQMITLGGFALLDTGGVPLAIQTRKQMALLAYLAVHPEKVFTRAILAPIFWGRDDEVRSRHSLSQALYDLKRVVGSDVVCTHGQMVWIGKETIKVDALELIRLAGDSRAEASHTADRLYQGDFLAGMALDEEPFDHWLLAEQERFRRIAQRSIGALISTGGEPLDNDDLLRVSRSLLKVDPFDEQAHCRIMEIYARQGVRSLAIAHFEKLAADLDRELDTRPSVRLVSTYQAIRDNAGHVSATPYRIEDYAFIVEQIPQPVVVTDMNHRIVGWNERSEQVFGFSKSEMFGRSLTMLYAPNRDSRLADDILGLALERGSWAGDVTLVTKGGSCSRQRRIVAPLYSPEGRCVGAFGQGLVS
ncbi:BTAD domain-containing putative transcriptional regulator [Paraburkholderia metrosideri]|uniref:BTAD domain-containing putative transcriptional regulator n=1 Tax=Paraburkholderia metrosideri TaxID=580937 RepID=A0ABW9DPC3_9BURK